MHTEQRNYTISKERNPIFLLGSQKGGTRSMANQDKLYNESRRRNNV